jgi:hypothetical protein
MKNRWYCDNRDLVKWGTLVHLARSEQIRTVIQVAFLRRRVERPPLQTDQGEAEIAQEVWRYLRDVNLICGLGKKTGLDIVVLDQEFDPKRRREYIREVADFLKSRPERKVVLLDPDTGIEPKKAGPKHVKVIEIQELWEALSQGDWLVLYQHASMQTDWREVTRAKFANACGAKEIKTFEAREIAWDVAFFAANKRC